jgi:hypothetical protein
MVRNSLIVLGAILTLTAICAGALEAYFRWLPLDPTTAFEAHLGVVLAVAFIVALAFAKVAQEYWLPTSRDESEPPGGDETM